MKRLRAIATDLELAFVRQGVNHELWSLGGQRLTIPRHRGRRVLHLLKLLAQGDRDLDAGRVHDTADVDPGVRARLAAHRDQA